MEGAVVLSLGEWGNPWNRLFLIRVVSLGEEGNSWSGSFPVVVLGLGEGEILGIGQFSGRKAEAK